VGANPAASAALTQLSAALANDNHPPAALIPIYQAAARRYNVPWQVLAAINAVETNYGQDLNVSSAGAIGWMQFMPATWIQYGVSANGRSKPDPYNPSDAIYSAARYLALNGAARNLPQAVYAYNHATSYVQEVLTIAEQITTNGLHPSSTVRTKLAAMQATARLLNGMPYVWGGGHAGWTISTGYDCSGFVSAVLHAAGYLTTPVTTQALPTQPGIASGPGKWVTIFDRTNAAITSDHVIIDIEGQWWESGGTTTAGVHRITAVTASYLTTFNLVLHPQGL
jgi:cell wall-associated NlpC family hydrolase